MKQQITDITIELTNESNQTLTIYKTEGSGLWITTCGDGFDFKESELEQIISALRFVAEGGISD